jgi:uncharacterized protein
MTTVQLLAIALFIFSVAICSGGQEEPKNISDLRKAAEQGDAESQASLAFYYRYGSLIKEDPDGSIAAHWYTKAAEQGHAYSQLILGDLYRDGGKGVLRNYAEAAKWYRKASESRTVEKQPGVMSIKSRAFESLGNLYLKGLGVPQDLSEAATCYGRSIEDGNDSSVFQLFSLCMQGKTTKLDCERVAERLAVLATKDDTVYDATIRSFVGADVAQYSLGLMHDKGLGVSPNYVEAAKWYQQSADRGNHKAQLALSGLYFEGKGVPHDVVRAYMWQNLAALRCPPEIQKEAAQMGSKIVAVMTPEQIAEAQRLAREWKPGK